MLYTIFTLSLISLVLLFWLYKLICHCFFKPFHLWKNQENSSVPSKEATMLSIKKLKDGKFPLLEIEVVFENFSGYPIQRGLRFRDSKPHLNRFKKDGKVRITLDPNKKPNPPYFLHSGKYKVSLIYILLCSLFTITYVAGCYFLMGEAISRIVSAPRYHENLFSNSSETTETLLFVSIILIVLNYILKKTGLLTSKRTKSQNWDLMYYGLGTMATVTSYEDTGTLINENPVVKFNYTYEDEAGNTLVGSDKKIVGKLEVIGLPDIHEIEIMYLPNNPQVSKLMVNLQKQSFQNFVNAMFMFCFFIFSVILVVSFYNDIF
ncbi:hypothetical protein AB1A65_04030 [Muricauda sp. ANG21]|uniref:hypothetical protein n=1 Tax=Allomuricauda sp. ANG21 TaxID=3042468 RepID=UPI00345517EF